MGAQPDDAAKLRAHVEELEARLADVETRVRRLEAPQAKPATAAPLAPETQRWRALSMNMSREAVRGALGEPMRIEGGSSEYWYYSGKSHLGPYVVFYNGRVSRWKEP